MVDTKVANAALPQHGGTEGTHVRREEMSAERTRGRHEQTNSRIKVWNCTSQEFRHARELHQQFFFAVAVIVQLEIQYGIAHAFPI